MAAAAFATELELAKFMHDILSKRDIVQQLKYHPETGDYDTAVEEALLAVGVSDVTAVTTTQGLRRLRAAARVELWRMVMGNTAGHHQRGTADTARSEQQVFDHAERMYLLALQDARRFGIASYRVSEAAHGSVKIDYGEGYYRGGT